MSSRGGGGGGRGRGNRGGGRGRGYQQSPGRGAGDGRGQQQSQSSGRGGRAGSGGSSVFNAPPEPSQISVSSAPLSRSSSTPLPSEFQQKLNVHDGSTSGHASSSSAAPVPQTVNVATSELAVPPPVSSKNNTVAVRPGYGKSGKRCTVRANHFLVQYAEIDLHQYDVSITPEVLSKKVCRDIMTDLIKKYNQSHLGGRAVAYDGRKSVYTAGALPFGSKDFVINLLDKDGPKREREFRVSIRFAAKADIHHLDQFLKGRQLDVPQETIQALDIVLREKPYKTYVTVGRSFFSESLGDRGELGQGLEYWHGFYQSLRPTQMGIALNIDISARPFYENILVTDFVAKYLSLRVLNRPLSDQDRLKVKKALRGVKVEVTYQPFARQYKICGLSTQPLNQLSFPDGSGKNISIVNYFHQKYNIRIQNGFLPAIQAGSDAKPTYLPMEVCKIVRGQRYTKKLNERQVAALLKATCRRPSDRENGIKKMVTVNDYNKQELIQKGFGMQVSSELTSIDARVLQPPVLRYHASGIESRVDPRVGQWNMINKKMINGARIDAWTCVNFSRAGPDIVKMFCKQLIEMCCSKGMVFNPQPLLSIQTFPPNRIENALVQIHSQCAGRQLHLLIVILPDTSGFYGTIKRICETQLGIVSQCCQPRHTTRISKQYLENVALKINVKVGGSNSVLEEAIERKMTFVSDIPTIIFGADVTHPQPGEDAGPSIAAVVASMDWPEVTKYRGLVSAQGHRQEIIQSLYTVTEVSGNVTVHGGMIREQLKAFRASRGLKPGRIIFYRDGVSEGQFNQVLWEEVMAIRKACFSLEENYAPRITFIVVQKRHHTRLFPHIHNDRHTTDKSGNILPGTVVDTNICHPSEFDFYLCSHAGIQGTSRPAHYRVLLDENNFSADQLQGLTNNLCYTYARCTRSVSVVPPAYYAHLLAFRARYYIEGRTSDGESSGVEGRAEGQQAVQVHALPEVKDNVKAVMFYC